MPLPLQGRPQRNLHGGGRHRGRPTSGHSAVGRGRLLGAGYECERSLSATVEGQPVRWTERVQIVRSLELPQRQQATLEKYLAAAKAEPRAMTPVK